SASSTRPLFSPFCEDQIAHLASQPLPTLTLKDLVRHGPPPLSPPLLLLSARQTRQLLPLRLARRILALRNLPFIIVSNPHISSIYNNYLHSLSLILAIHPNQPTTLEQEAKFTDILKEVVKTHSNTIPTLAKGFIECRRYITPEEVTKFLDTHLRERIGTRLVAEQHIALHEGTVGTQQKPNPEPCAPEAEKAATHSSTGPGGTYIGTIDTGMLPSRIISSCATFVGDICSLRYGVRPKLIIEGHMEQQFPYIPVHLEYIMTELLKNAFRATIESPSSFTTPDEENPSGLPPVVVTIACSSPSINEAAGEKSGGDGDGGGGSGERRLTIRIRDRGGGIAPEVQSDIWKYSFTTFDPERGRYYPPSSSHTHSIAGLGYGLPLSRAYAEYFGGSLSVQSCWGWGTDVYLVLRGV
ncbi:branched-chain alpha-ketoacid dehydrogenase, partial [Kalaharituber pfeilii]